MKKVISLIILISSVFAVTAQAQENENEFKSIFGQKKKSNKVSHGGFGAFGVGYANIDGRDALTLNLRGAWVINHNMALGLSGTGFFNNLDKATSNTRDYLGGGYGGFFFQPIIFPQWPVHISIPVVVGGGAVSTIPYDYWDWNLPPYTQDYDVFFVVEPGIEIELNMAKFFRMGLGATYRYTNGVVMAYPNGVEVSTRALDGFNFHLNFKFGKF